MDPDIIILKQRALEGIVISVQETIKKSESYGTLYGKYKEGKDNSVKWIVEFVLPNQLVKRCGKSIIYERKKDIERAEYFEFKDKVLGTFHSHIPVREEEGLSKLSKEDKKDMEHNRIDLLIGIKRIKKEGIIKENPYLISWYPRDNGQIYRADMKGYYLNKRMRRAILKAPKDIFKVSK